MSFSHDGIVISLSMVNPMGIPVVDAYLNHSIIGIKHQSQDNDLTS